MAVKEADSSPGQPPAAPPCQPQRFGGFQASLAPQGKPPPAFYSQKTLTLLIILIFFFPPFLISLRVGFLCAQPRGRAAALPVMVREERTGEKDGGRGGLKEESICNY